MNNPKRIAGTLIVLAVFGSALFYALRSNEQTQALEHEQSVVAQTAPLKGLTEKLEVSRSYTHLFKGM